MISHKDCDHLSTPGARAKCRRAKGGATPKEVDLSKANRSRAKDPDDNYGQVPRDRDKQCMNCGVEKIAWKGTDPLSNLLLFVGERCEYIVRRSLDKAPAE